jgi:DHA1 family inner membrane transport protein
LGALLSVGWLVPANLASHASSFVGFRAVATNPAVLRVWLRTLLYFIAVFSVFAYIGPLLQALNPMSSGGLSLTLAAFGLSGVAGTLVGGWANDRFGSLRTLVGQLTVMIVMMALLPLTQGYIPLMVIALVVWGVAGFGMMTPQQSRLASLSPKQAPLLLSLNGSMLYMGTALGSMLSGALLDTLGLVQLAWVGVPFALLALLTLVFDRRAAKALAAAKAGAIASA